MAVLTKDEILERVQKGEIDFAQCLLHVAFAFESDTMTI